MDCVIGIIFLLVISASVWARPQEDARGNGEFVWDAIAKELTLAKKQFGDWDAVARELTQAKKQFGWEVTHPNGEKPRTGQDTRANGGFDWGAIDDDLTHAKRNPEKQDVRANGGFDWGAMDDDLTHAKREHAEENRANGGFDWDAINEDLSYAKRVIEKFMSRKDNGFVRNAFEEELS